MGTKIARKCNNDVRVYTQRSSGTGRRDTKAGRALRRKRFEPCSSAYRSGFERRWAVQSAESAIGFGRRLQRREIAGLRNRESCSIPTAPTSNLIESIAL